MTYQSLAKQGNLLFLSILLFSSPLLANTDLVSQGAIQGAVCKACHQVDKGGSIQIGPPLWDLAERDIASYPDFAYSEQLQKSEGRWDAEKLDAFLANPNDFAPGTKMVFPGIQDPGARAAIIAWLGSKHTSPPDWSTNSINLPIQSPGDGILAPGENMALVASVCSACHSLHLVTQQGLSRDSWKETLEWMVDEQGMDPLEPKDLDAVLDYLAQHYGR